MTNTLSGDFGFSLPNTLDNESPFDYALTGYLPLDGSSPMQGDLNMSGHSIINLDAPVNALDATNKTYVDNAIITAGGNYVDLTTNQSISGTKTFFNTVSADGIIQLKRTATTDNVGIRYLNNVNATLWTIGNQSDANENLILSKDGTTPLLTLNYLTPELSLNGYRITSVANATTGTDALNRQTADGRYVDLLTTQFVGGSKIFTQSGDGFVTVNRANNVSNFAYIQLWTGLATSWRFGMRNDSTENFHFIKDGTTNIVTINYTTPSLSLNNYKIINLLDPTNAQDGATKAYVDSHTSGNYVTLATTQTITGEKTIGPITGGNDGYFRINRGASGSYAFTRYLAQGTSTWDVGMYATTNQFYWYHTPTALTAMALTTTGRLGIGTLSPTDKLEIANGSIVVDRTDALPALFTLSTNSNSASAGSMVQLFGINSRAEGVVYGTNGSNNRYFMGRPYDAGNNTENRFVLGYVNSAVNVQEERTGGGVRNYTPSYVCDTGNKNGINTITPSVNGLEVTGQVKNTQSAQSSPILTGQIQIFNNTNIATTTYATRADMLRELVVNDVIQVGGVNYTIAAFPLGTTIQLTVTPAVNLGPVNFTKSLSACTPILTEPTILNKEPSKTTIESLHVSTIINAPRKTTAQRDELSPQGGSIVFNTTTSKLQVWDGGAWINLH